MSIFIILVNKLTYTSTTRLNYIFSFRKQTDVDYNSAKWITVP
jgi:hypothetical protein